MREQLRQSRLGVIGAMSVACILATAPASNAAGLTAPVATTTGTYQGPYDSAPVMRQFRSTPP